MNEVFNSQTRKRIEEIALLVQRWYDLTNKGETPLFNISVFDVNFLLEQLEMLEAKLEENQ